MRKDKQTMTRQEITRTIRVLSHRGEPLNISAVKRRHPELIRTVYAMKPFLGWKGALDAAGVDYFKIKVELLHEITCELCGKQLGALSHHLRCLHGYSIKTYRQDFPEAPVSTEIHRARNLRQCRGTGRAAKALIPHWERLWTPEYVLDRIHELHNRGFDINRKAVECRDGVAPAAVRRFGSWDAALKALGLSPDRIRLKHPTGYWKRELILRQIRARKKAGLSLSTARMRKERKSGAPLFSAAAVVFGSWEKAIEAAGLDYVSIRLSHPARYPTKRAVIKEIHRRRRAGLPLNISAVESGPHKDCALVGSAQRILGGWRYAMRAAGLV